ncbi:hypothetical protein LPY66_15340 [Dehalobacter sp. DCM]|uniref:hypothetical protein n=1 Tax=Dehalobacter sp. DCM TaxID=2907827 RepID=UPI003081834D|nr:hypothetical protein LPY66_15340 [Dehalobacter sp. DCM]
MKREDFVLSNNSYEIEVDGISVKIRKDAFDEKSVTYANRIFELYLSKKHEIIGYILSKCLLDFYSGSYSKDEIVNGIKEAQI